MANDSSLRIGTLLNGGTYRVDGVLGSGGFGITYRAVHVELGRTVAIKEFFINEFCVRGADGLAMSVAVENNQSLVDGFKQKFLQEAKLVARLNNRHIIDVFDIFEENGTAYYVMDYLSGGSLADKVSANGALEKVEAGKVITQLAAALSYIHGQKILHLDVKPSNVMFDGEGNVVLIDFGISKQYGAENSKLATDTATYSRIYAPIEQYEKGGVSSFVPALDVYSFGATVYFLLSGLQPPTAFDVLKNGLESVPGAGKKLTAAVIAAMQPVQAERLKSIADFIAMVKKQKKNPIDEPVKAKKDEEVDKDLNTIIDVPQGESEETRMSASSDESNETNSPVPANDPEETKMSALADIPDETIKDVPLQNTGAAPRKKGLLIVVLIVSIVLAVTSLGIGAYFLIAGAAGDESYYELQYMDYEDEGDSYDESLFYDVLESVGVFGDQYDVEEESDVDVVLEDVMVEADSVVWEELFMEAYDDIAENAEIVSENLYSNESLFSETITEVEETYHEDVASDGMRYALNGNYKRAVPLLKKAAEEGDAEAQNLLGECYQKGNGVDVDYNMAVSYYRMAANQGNADAQSNMAVCYSRGIGGLKKNMGQALKYFNNAANQGHAMAQYNMGEFYRTGGVVSIDIETAMMWYRRAAAQGNEFAVEKLRQLENRY